MVLRINFQKIFKLPFFFYFKYYNILTDTSLLPCFDYDQFIAAADP